MPFLRRYAIIDVEIASGGIRVEIINGIRYIGNPKDKLKKVAMVGHLLPNIFEHQPTTGDGFCKEYATEVIRIMEEEDVDAIIPGETIDWTVMSYIRDARTIHARPGQTAHAARTAAALPANAAPHSAAAAHRRSFCMAHTPLYQNFMRFFWFL